MVKSGRRRLVPVRYSVVIRKLSGTWKKPTPPICAVRQGISKDGIAAICPLRLTPVVMARGWLSIMIQIQISAGDRSSRERRLVRRKEKEPGMLERTPGLPILVFMYVFPSLGV